jgi:hypothetical protein
VLAPDDGEGRERDQQQGADEVLGQAEQPPVPDEREGEVAVEQRAERLDDRREQDDEGPERDGVAALGRRPPRPAP